MQPERVRSRSVGFVDEGYGDYHGRCATWCSDERKQAKSMIIEAGICHTLRNDVNNKNDILPCDW